MNAFAILNNERFLEKCEPSGQPRPMSVSHGNASCFVKLRRRADHMVVVADGWGFSQMGAGDGVRPGPNALKSQIIGFLFAAAYMRGAPYLM